MKRVVLLIVSILCSTPVWAAETDLWFGSADQAPFKFDPNEPVVSVSQSDSLETKAYDTMPAPVCGTEGCITPQDPAIATSAAGSTPKN
jgi:hypothetical protein